MTPEFLEHAEKTCKQFATGFRSLAKLCALAVVSTKTLTDGLDLLVGLAVGTPQLLYLLPDLTEHDVQLVEALLEGVELPADVPLPDGQVAEVEHHVLLKFAAVALEATVVRLHSEFLPDFVHFVRLFVRVPFLILLPHEMYFLGSVASKSLTITFFTILN